MKINSKYKNGKVSEWLKEPVLKTGTLKGVLRSNRSLSVEKRKAYLRKYQNNWMRIRRLSWIESQGGKCVICGSIERLEVDHINPKEKTDHKVWSWTAKKRELELLKCQVLCRECHQKKSISERPYKTDHGRAWMYQGHKCRCELCREWKRNSDRKYYKRKIKF